MSLAVKHLVAMRDLLAMPDAWTSNDMAVDRYDHPVSPDSNRAHRWSLDGAYQNVSPPYNPDGFMERAMLSEEIERLIGLPRPWLDWEQKPGRTVAQVLAALDYAIERGRANGG